MSEYAGRRSAPRAAGRPTVTVVLAVLLPLLTVGALALVGEPLPADEPQAPDTAPLTRSTLVCPGPAGEDSTTAVAHSDPSLGGRLHQLLPSRGEVAVDDGAVTELPADRTDGPVVLRAVDRVAPGPVAGRWGPAGATTCPAPSPETWFAGLAAGPERSSRLELVNPDRGPAIADITVHGPQGVLDVPGLRGIKVDGHESTTIDLGAVVPTREDLVVQVRLGRGRLVAAARTTVDPIGQGRATMAWVPGQPEPAETAYLPGVPVGADDPVLVVANPGEDAARVALEVVSNRSEFAPEGAEGVQVAPGAVEVVDLDEVLGGSAVEDATGLLVRSSEPVVPGFRGSVDQQPVNVAAAPPVEGRAAAVLPPGPKRLVAAGSSGNRTARVTARGADGTELLQRRVRLAPGRSSSLDLPPKARVVVVDLRGGSARLGVTTERPRPSVVPLAELQLTSKVPAVEPALAQASGR